MSTRHVFAATFVATLVLNACSAPAPTPPAEPTPPADEPGELGQTWHNIAGGSETALLLTDATNEGVLQLVCARSPARMIVRVRAFNVIESEERLSFGLDNEPTVFVAQTQAPTDGVEAEGPIDPAFLDRLVAAETVSASYGAQSLGPLPAPGREKAETFAAGCRAGAAGT